MEKVESTDLKKGEEYFIEETKGKTVTKYIGTYHSTYGINELQFHNCIKVNETYDSYVSIPGLHIFTITPKITITFYKPTDVEFKNTLEKIFKTLPEEIEHYIMGFISKHKKSHEIHNKKIDPIVKGYFEKYGIPYKGQYDIKNGGTRKSKRKYGRKDTKNKTRYNHKNKK
jgi:hypothetical protein